MLRDNPGVECVQPQDITNIHILARQFLHDDAFSHVILTEAANFYRKRGADQSEFAHLVNLFFAEGLLRVMGFVVGRQPLASEPPCRITDRILIVGKIKIHRFSPR